MIRNSHDTQLPLIIDTFVWFANNVMRVFSALQWHNYATNWRPSGKLKPYQNHHRMNQTVIGPSYLLIGCCRLSSKKEKTLAKCWRTRGNKHLPRRTLDPAVCQNYKLYVFLDDTSLTHYHQSPLIFINHCYSTSFNIDSKMIITWPWGSKETSDQPLINPQSTNNQ